MPTAVVSRPDDLRRSSSSVERRARRGCRPIRLLSWRRGQTLRLRRRVSASSCVVEKLLDRRGGAAAANCVAVIGIGLRGGERLRPRSRSASQICARGRATATWVEVSVATSVVVRLPIAVVLRPATWRGRELVEVERVEVGRRQRVELRRWSDREFGSWSAHRAGWSRSCRPPWWRVPPSCVRRDRRWPAWSRTPGTSVVVSVPICAVVQHRDLRRASDVLTCVVVRLPTAVVSRPETCAGRELVEVERVQVGRTDSASSCVVVRPRVCVVRRARRAAWSRNLPTAVAGQPADLGRP